MSDNIEHRAFWDMDEDDDIALPYTGWYPIERIIQHQEEDNAFRKKKMQQMTDAFNSSNHQQTRQ